MKAIEEIEDPEIRNFLIELVAATDRNKDRLFEDLIVEGLTNEDVLLVKEIYTRLRDYIQGSVLLSFMELRRQIKASQRELADHRKQTDREFKASAQFREDVLKELRQIKSSVKHLQIPIHKGSGDPETQRREFYNIQRRAYQVIIKVAQKMGISI